MDNQIQRTKSPAVMEVDTYCGKSLPESCYPKRPIRWSESIGPSMGYKIPTCQCPKLIVSARTLGL